MNRKDVECITVPHIHESGKMYTLTKPYPIVKPEKEQDKKQMKSEEACKKSVDATPLEKSVEEPEPDNSVQATPSKKSDEVSENSAQDSTSQKSVEASENSVQATPSKKSVMTTENSASQKSVDAPEGSVQATPS